LLDSISSDFRNFLIIAVVNMKSVSYRLSLVLFLRFASYDMVGATPQPSTTVSLNGTLIPNGTGPFSKLGLIPAIFQNLIMNCIRLPTYRNPLPIPFRWLYLLPTRGYLHHSRPRSRNLCIFFDIALYLSSIPNMHSLPRQSAHHRLLLPSRNRVHAKWLRVPAPTLLPSSCT
jgi:hypothetical protein